MVLPTGSEAREAGDTLQLMAAAGGVNVAQLWENVTLETTAPVFATVNTSVWPVVLAGSSTSEDAGVTETISGCTTDTESTAVALGTGAPA